MSDRPAPQTSPSASLGGTTTTRSPKPAKTAKTPKAPRLQKPSSLAEDTVTTPVGADAGSTAERVGLAERIQAKLSSGTSDRGDAEAVVAAPAPKARPRGPRRARLRLTRIDPWSVMKTAFLLSIAVGIVLVVAVAMIWEVIGAAGVWDSINDTVKEVVDEPGTADFDIKDYVGTDRVLGFTMLVAAVDVVLMTAIATLAAFLYNMSAALLGGIEVTLAEDH